MTTTNKNITRALSRLYQLVEASEKGYAVAASSVKNQAIKVLFKSYAQKRAAFKEELWAEMQRLGSTAKPASSILGAIHRGRVTIFAVMTIGEENIEKVVLKEVLLGEKVARYFYERVLKKDLPDTTRKIVQNQYENVQELIVTVQSMLGKDGKKLIVWLYDTDKDADKAVDKLKTSGYSIKSIEKRTLSAMKMYTEENIKVFETALSGAVGGAIWATIGGLLVLVALLQTTQPDLGNSPLQIAFLSLLGLMIAGMFVGGMLGFFIGSGIKNDDAYLYKESIDHKLVLVQVLADSSRASLARDLLHRVQLEAQA
jgi:uncharacterized protein (TIGR02284 family)